MTTSSIHFKRVDPFFCEKHNSRETEKQPTYLLDTDLRKSNDFVKLADISVLHNEQLEIRKTNRCRGKAPELRDSCWEAVVNLEGRHSLEDLQPVMKLLKEKYHLTPTSVAIHRDEGYYDELHGTIKYNYHAHIPCYTVYQGKSVMRTIGKKQLSDMQTEVADLLGMQRGQENSKATRLDHKQYRAKAKELARIEQKHNLEIASAKQKQELAETALQLVEPTLQRSKTEKEQLNGTVKSLNDEILSLKAQKAIVEAERKKYKDEGDHIASEYRKLQELNKTLHTQEELDNALANLRQEYEARLALKPKEVVKEVIKTVEKIVEKSIQVEVPRQLTESEIEELPRVQELNNRLKKQSEELECAQGRISYLEQAYNQTLYNYSVLQKDYNELAKDYRKLEKSYNDLNTQYNLIIRSGQKSSEIDENASKYTRVRIDTENQSENILEAYARKLGLNKKSEPEQTDKLHGTEKTTQTTSFLRSTKGFHR